MNQLITSAGKNLPEVPWADYPRPQLRRADWLCLNGVWDFSHVHAGELRQGHITVPFCPESLLSGVDGAPDIGSEMVYARRFSVPAAWQGRHILLHFGAVSRHCEVELNGAPVITHDNGYLPFAADITALLREGENELRVRAVNDLSHRYPWGKQKLDRGGMWYMPVSGIWQSVWLEPVPETHIRDIRYETGPDFVTVSVVPACEGTVLLDGQRAPLTEGNARLHINNPILWTPENPHLYGIRIECGKDCVESYFALQTLTTETVKGIRRLCLNGKPYFFNGLLDQGYWSDGLYTPADPAAYGRDILAMKELGFNTLRKHIKIEPERFYYDCDRLGMIVFQDMVNCGDYSFFRDTALPTVNLQRLPDRRLHRDPETRREFLRSMEETVHLLSNHPSICLWTIFNEGWGQFCADDAYRKLKSLDSTRFVDSTSGWFHQKLSDVDSLHIYFKKLRLGKEKLPQVLSEFGGYVYKIPAHSFNPDSTYGYRMLKSREDFAAAFRKLYDKELRPLISRGLCAAIYTQVSDVEDETNGLLTFDRAEQKLTAAEIRPLMDSLQQEL